MTIYIIIWFLLFICAIAHKRWTNASWVLYVLFFLLLTIVAGGRELHVGVDTHTYYSIYRGVNREGYYGYLEPMWNVLNLVCPSFPFLLTLVAALTLFPIFFVGKKASDNPFSVVFVYYSLQLYTASFNMMRQGLAISWIMISFYYFIKQDKLYKAALCLLFASTIHYSSVLAIVAFPFLKYVRITPNRLIVYLLLALFTGAVASTSFFGFFASSEFQFYITDNKLYRSSFLLPFIMAVMIGLFVYFILKTSPRHSLNNPWYKLVFLYALVVCVTFKLHYGARLYYMFFTSQFLVLPMYLKCNRFKSKEIPTIVVFLFLILMFARQFVDDVGSNNVLPYESIWF